MFMLNKLFEFESESESYMVRFHCAYLSLIAAAQRNYTVVTAILIVITLFRVVRLNFHIMIMTNKGKMN